MITPSFALTATERVLPSMALDFTTASLDSRVTFTRSGNTATVTNSSGVIAAINANLPRFDYDPTTLVCKGLLIEDARTNVLVNSLIDGTNLSTQLITTTAVAYTLSFYGTGQIVLSGSSTATVVGTGAYPSRKTLTFTPTAGVLTLTVTGTVQYAQLEVGAFATSFIPTDATSKTRNADIATMTGTNFTSWFNASEGAFMVQSNTFFAGNQGILSIGDPTKGFAARETYYFLNSAANSGRIYTSIATAGVEQFNSQPVYTFAINTPATACFAYKTNSAAGSVNGTANTTDTSVTLPTVTQVSIGSLNSAWSGAGTYLYGHVQRIQYWPQRLINAEVQAFSK